MKVLLFRIYRPLAKRQASRACARSGASRRSMQRIVQVAVILSFLVALFAQNPPLGAQKVAPGEGYVEATCLQIVLAIVLAAGQAADDGSARAAPSVALGYVELVVCGEVTTDCFYKI